MTHRSGFGLAVLLILAGAACRDAAPPATGRKAQPVLGEQQNEVNTRRALLEALQPVTLKNCKMKRFGSAADGGYLMCENLLQDVTAGYSYGIGGNDEWGCEVSRLLKMPVHQYDCFEPPTMACPGGQFVPHNECVGPVAETAEARVFDTVQNQIVRNGDSGKRLLVKMDVEGAEWKALMATPDEILATFDQLPMELHGTSVPLFLEVVQKLKRNFYVVHLHFNNWACRPELAPFPATVYQVLFVNKRVGIPGTPDPAMIASGPLDAPDNPKGPDCQLPSS